MYVLIDFEESILAASITASDQVNKSFNELSMPKLCGEATPIKGLSRKLLYDISFQDDVWLGSLNVSGFAGHNAGRCFAFLAAQIP